jgi:hypothetical protein
MTEITRSFADVFFTKDYADPTICYYYFYLCTNCDRPFRLIDPDNNFRAGGATRTVRYRNPDTGEIKAKENRSEGVCLDCCVDIAKLQEEKDKKKRRS